MNSGSPGCMRGQGIAFAELSSKAAMYAALKADGAAFQKRELRVTRLKPASAQKGTAPSQRRLGHKPQGAAAQGAQRRMQRTAAPSRESWQGTRTKGPSKVLCLAFCLFLAQRSLLPDAVMRPLHELAPSWTAPAEAATLCRLCNPKRLLDPEQRGSRLPRQLQSKQ